MKYVAGQVFGAFIRGALVALCLGVVFVMTGCAKGGEIVPAGNTEVEVEVDPGEEVTADPGGAPARWELGKVEFVEVRSADGGPLVKPRALMAMGDHVLICIYGGELGRELWCSDGTREGTRRLDKLSASSDSNSDIKDMEEMIGLMPKDDSNAKEVERMREALAERKRRAARAGGAKLVIGALGKLFFQRQGSLWQYDPNTNAEVSLAEVTAGIVRPLGPEIWNTLRRYPKIESKTHLFFVTERKENVWELWASDGTKEGTNPLVLIDHGEFENPVEGWPLRRWGVLEEKLFFTGFDESGRAVLLSSDGTKEGTKPVKVLEESPQTPGVLGEGFAAFQGTIYFFHKGLWKSDGTAEGTARICEGIRPDIMMHAGPKLLYFLVRVPGSEKRDLWVTDGTAEGTGLFKKEASLGPLGNVGGKALFHSGEWIQWADPDQRVVNSLNGIVEKKRFMPDARLFNGHLFSLMDEGGMMPGFTELWVCPPGERGVCLKKGLGLQFFSMEPTYEPVVAGEFVYFIFPSKAGGTVYRYGPCKEPDRYFIEPRREG